MVVADKVLVIVQRVLPAKEILYYAIVDTACPMLLIAQPSSKEMVLVLQQLHGVGMVIAKQIPFFAQPVLPARHKDPFYVLIDLALNMQSYVVRQRTVQSTLSFPTHVPMALAL